MNWKAHETLQTGRNEVFQTDCLLRLACSSLLSFIIVHTKHGRKDIFGLQSNQIVKRKEKLRRKLRRRRRRRKLRSKLLRRRLMIRKMRKMRRRTKKRKEIELKGGKHNRTAL